MTSGKRKDRKPAAEIVEHVATMVADLAGLMASHSDDIIEWFEARRAKKREGQDNAD